MSDKTMLPKSKKQRKTHESEKSRDEQKIQSNIVICSAFRNAQSYIDRYFLQVEALDQLLTQRGDSLSLVIGYGDSTDDTDALLFEHTSGGVGARLIDVTHDGQVYGSIVDAERFKQLAYVGNKILANVPDDATAVIWLESDLIWDADTLIKLIDRLQDVPSVAPMIMELSTGGFYDTWAFRRAGAQFEKQAPYHPSLNSSDSLVRMDSVGSCFAMRGDIAKRIHSPDEDVVVGMCRQIYEMNESVWLDSSLTVHHA